MRGPALVGAWLAVLLLAGCASADGDSPGRTSNEPADSGSEVHITRTALPGPLARCRVHGFRPAQHVVVRSQRHTTLYAAALSLAPGSSVRGADRLQLVTGLVPGVRVSSPRGASLDPSTRGRIGTRIEDTSAAPLAGEFYARRRVENRSGARRDYAAYVTARVYRGTWTARVCGGLTNDGRRVSGVRGTVVAVGSTDSGVLPCEEITTRSPDWVRRLAAVCR